MDVEHLDTAPDHEPDAPPADDPEEESAPTLTDGVLKPLAPGYVQAERLGGDIFTAVAALALLAGAGWAVFREWVPSDALSCAVLTMIWGVLVFALFKILRAFVLLNFERTRYAVHDHGLEIHKGVWWRSVTMVCRSRVQHTDVSQGPLQRRWGIATLTVHTAGTESATIELSGVSRETADRIRDFLLLGEGDETV